MKLFKRIGALLIGALMSMGTALAAAMPPEQQIDILAQNIIGSNGWLVEPLYDANCDKWYYAVTDLNHDGSLEILKAKNGFNNDIVQLQCDELVEGKGIRHVDIKLKAGSYNHIPDIMSGESAKQPGVVYNPKTREYYYIFNEVIMHSEFDSTTTLYAISLDKTLSIEALASMIWRLSGYDGTVTHLFYRNNPFPEAISQEQYKACIKERFPDCTEAVGQIKWYSADEVYDYMDMDKVNQLLMESYKEFR